MFAVCAASALVPRSARAQSDLLDSAYAAAEMGMWDASAHAWRRVLERNANLAGAAAYTLRAAPTEARASIRRQLLSPPVVPGGRRALAQLETAWGSPRDGWAALQGLPATDSTVVEWIEFADAAEAAGAPLVARDAYVAALAVHPTADVAVRAADAALSGGDASQALTLLDRAAAATRASGVPDTAAVAATLVPLRVRALVRLGRMDDAEAQVRATAGRLSPDTRGLLEREITWGYVRTGDIPHARAAAVRFGLSDDTEVGGWLALYAGDLKGARAALHRTDGLSPDGLTALTLLGRTTVGTAPAVGEAFVLLARGDTAAAADRFVAASSVVRDAAPLLLATAARLHAAQHRDALAVPLWRTVVEQYASAPEAPEADLEWGRALKRSADPAGAIARWEHLILSYPESALVPLARRELEAAKATA